MCKVVEDLCNDAKIEEKKEIAEYVGMEVEVVNVLDEKQKAATY